MVNRALLIVCSVVLVFCIIMVPFYIHILSEISNVKFNVEWGAKPSLTFEQKENINFMDNNDNFIDNNDDNNNDQQSNIDLVYYTTSSQSSDENQEEIIEELQHILLEENDKVNSELSEIQITFPSHLRKCESANIIIEPKTQLSKSEIELFRTKFTIMIEYLAIEHPDDYENTAFDYESTKILPMLLDLSDPDFYR